MFVEINSKFEDQKPDLIQLLHDFDTTGKRFGNGQRNTIKIFELAAFEVNIKSFKVPNLINRIAYCYFRKSKARRSYEFANKLKSMKIGTPEPIGFAENSSISGLGRSFYMSENLNVDLTFRELVQIPDFPDHKNILRQFVSFCFDLHQKGVLFLDHSPGNTLIKKVGEEKYEFFLVDLNRMEFHQHLDFDQRMKNLSRLTPKEEMVREMSIAYAELYPEKSQPEIFGKLWYFTQVFQKNYHRKQAMKKKYGLSRSS